MHHVTLGLYSAIYSLLCMIILGQVSLTSSISGRNACPSEEVTFTCTAQTTAVFWGYEEFGEKTMHYTTPASRGDFRAEIVSYDRNQSCLVSSLSFRATASRNGTTVTCTSRDRSSSQSLPLHIMSEYILLMGFNVAKMYDTEEGTEVEKCTVLMVNWPTYMQRSLHIWSIPHTVKIRVLNWHL